MNGSAPAAYSNLEWILARRNLSVPALRRRLEDQGVPVNIKSLYRLTGGTPLEKIDLRIAAAICMACEVDFGDLISFQKPKAQFEKLDIRTQSRLDSLMAKNNEGQLTAAEKKEFARLADQAHEISVRNARMLLSECRRVPRRAAVAKISAKNRQPVAA